MDFIEDKHTTVQHIWKFLFDHIQIKAGGIKFIEEAINKIYANENYRSLVQEAFTKGLNPPMKLTDQEVLDVINLIKKAEASLLSPATVAA